MSVLVESYNLIIKRAALDRCYPGGAGLFEIDSPNKTFCKDDHLVRLGFQVGYDAKNYAENLIATHDLDVNAVAIVCHYRGLMTQTDWLELKWEPDGVTCCWLKGTEPGEMALPACWDPDEARKVRSGARLVDMSQPHDLEYIGRNENGVDIYCSRLTGGFKYVGRVITDPPATEVLKEKTPEQPAPAAKPTLLERIFRIFGR